VERTEVSPTRSAATRAFNGKHAIVVAPQRGAVQNLVANGGFSAQPNPLAFWTNAPGAFATWISEGANASLGSVHLRFLPPISVGDATRGAVYYTGLTQCVAIPRSGRYLLSAFARVPASASPSSIAGLGWTLRYDGVGCTGAADTSGRAGIVRSTTWIASSVDSIQIRPEDWTTNTTLAIAVEVGDSSTTSIEPVEALVDEVWLVEGPLFADGFED
jgi:hypothetical protein